MPEKRNPKLFRECNEPFDSKAEIDAAYKAFSDALVALREEHKIANVYVIVESSYLLPDGTEVDSGATLCLGDSFKRLPMTAWAYGKEKQAFNETIARLSSGKD